MCRNVWIFSLLLVAVVSGPLGIHDFAHSFDSDHHAEHAKQDGTDNCVACATVTPPIIGLSVAVPMPPVQVSCSVVLLAHVWIEFVPLETNGERAPPTLS